MQLKATMTQSEVPLLVKDRQGNLVENPDYPMDGQCKSGHVVPIGTRFFLVSGSVVPEEVAGLYCEPCLIVANTISHHEKNNLPLPFDPEEELQRLVRERFPNG